MNPLSDFKLETPNSLTQTQSNVEFFDRCIFSHFQMVKQSHDFTSFTAFGFGVVGTIFENVKVLQ